MDPREKKLGILKQALSRVNRLSVEADILKKKIAELKVDLLIQEIAKNTQN